MNLRSAAVAVACGLSVMLVVATGASAAKTPKPMCKLGQSPVLERTKCTANPLLAKTVCQSTWTPVVEALAPGIPVAGYDLNGAAFGALSCFWKSGSVSQVFVIQAGSVDGATDQSGKKITAAQSWQLGIQLDKQTWDTPDNETCPNGTRSMVPQLTTIEGYPAYTEDPCPSDTDGWASVHVFVSGHARFFVAARWSVIRLTSQQLTPVVEQAIAKYMKFLKVS